MGEGVGLRLGLLILLAAASFATVGTAQTDQPEWKSDLFEEIERAANEYNARGGFDEGGIFERWFLRNTRINLYVHEGDSTATYSFHIDADLRVTSLERRGHSDPTFRVKASKATVEGIIATDDKDAAIHRGIRTGRIRVERVIRPLGVEIAVGIEEVAVGLTGTVLALVAVSKFGIGGTVSLLKEAVRRVVQFVLRVAGTLWQNLAGIATGLTVLEQLGLLDDLKLAIRKVSAAIRKKVAAIRDRLRRPSSAENEDEE